MKTASDIYEVQEIYEQLFLAFHFFCAKPLWKIVANYYHYIKRGINLETISEKKYKKVRKNEELGAIRPATGGYHTG